MLVLLLIGGSIYFCIEVMWRGYSHVSMFFIGGLCFVAIGSINELLLAPGGISHSGPGENRQFWPDENSQS